MEDTMKFSFFSHLGMDIFNTPFWLCIELLFHCDSCRGNKHTPNLHLPFAWCC
jgi:hypothetical protein